MKETKKRKTRNQYVNLELYGELRLFPNLSFLSEPLRSFSDNHNFKRRTIIKKIVIASIIAVLLVMGCGNDNNKTETTQHQNIKTAHKSEIVSEEKVVSPTEEQVSQKAAEVKKAAEELATAIKEKTAPVIEKAKEKAIDLKETIQETTEQGIKKTKETTTELVETVKEKSAPVIVKSMDTAAEITHKAVEKVQGMGTSQPVAAEIIVLKNKKGKIIFPHKTHSKSFACKTCHGGTEPGPFSLGKEAGHKLCKGCHKEKHAGPTKCSGCHAKKDTKIIEGC